MDCRALSLAVVKGSPANVLARELLSGQPMSTRVLGLTPAESDGRSWLRRIERALAELKQPLNIAATHAASEGGDLTASDWPHESLPARDAS